MNSSNDSFAGELGERLRAIRAHLEAGIELARQGLSVAGRSRNEAAEQFFQRCVHELERAQSDARALDTQVASDPGTELAPGEQISTASFAPGDGATDAEVTPERARGKPGNWPAY